MPSHHPTTDELLSYVLGQADEWLSVLIATHLTLCPKCRSEVHELEAIGAALLEEARPAALGGSSLPADPRGFTAPVPAKRREVPDAIARVVPRPLHPFMEDATPRFRWKAPGLQHIPLKLSSGARPLRLVRFRPGFVVPEHAHSGLEWLLILRGELTDRTTGERYARGDVSRRDTEHVHSQVIGRDEPCIAVFAHLGSPLPLTLLGKTLARIVGL